MTAAIPWIMAASTAVSAYGAYQQGQAANAAAQYNAQINTQNAQIASQDAALQAQQQDRQNRLRLGSITAAQGASGFTGSGSVFDVLGDVAAQGELQKQNILYKGALNARGYTNTAALDVMQGQQAKTAGALKAGTNLLSGGVDTYKSFKRYG